MIPVLANRRKPRRLRNGHPDEIIVEVVLVAPANETVRRRHAIACLALLNLGRRQVTP